MELEVAHMGSPQPRSSVVVPLARSLPAVHPVARWWQPLLETTLRLLHGVTPLPKRYVDAPTPMSPQSLEPASARGQGMGGALRKATERDDECRGPTEIDT